MSVWVVTPEGLKNEDDLRVEYLGEDSTFGVHCYWWKCLLCETTFMTWDKETPAECPNCQ